MSFPRYGAYKDSGVEWLGEVPAHWVTRRLKQICRVFPSNVDKKSYEGDTPVLLCNYTDVYYNEQIVRGMPFMEATATPEQVEKFTLRAGDTIITKDSETADDIAVAAYVPEELPDVVCGYHLSMIRPGAGVSGRFIKRFFDSHFAKARFEVSANGLTRVGLSQYAIDNVLVPCPPLDEQTAIATFLDRETAKIDELVAEQRNLIALLKEKRQALISHAVTKGLDPAVPMKDSGVEWLGEVPAHWEVSRIKHIVWAFSQGWSPQCDGYPAESEDVIGVLKVGCVNGGTFKAAENKALPAGMESRPDLGLAAGDVLVSRANTRELVGSAAVVERDFPNLLLCDKLYRIRANERVFHPTLLARFLGTACVRGQIEVAATGASSSMLNIGQGTILELAIPVPPLDEQAAIVSELETEAAKVDELVAEAETTITLLHERRTALISAAVTGKIDVRGQVAAAGRVAAGVAP